MATPYPGKSPFSMLSVEECVALVEKMVPMGEVEDVTLSDSLGRRLAEDVTALVPIPAFPTSIMDGFAVRSTDGPGRYPVEGDALAGRSAGALRAGHVRYITTGSKVPEQSDAVVKVEDTVQHVSSDAVEVEIQVSSSPGANIRQVGSDTAQGETLLQRGCLLGASELGVLAALNCGRVRVFRAATVAVLSTGDELKELGAAPDMARGQIIDSNRPLLCAMLKEAGAKVLDLGMVPDELSSVRATLDEALNSADVVIISGGVSRGSKDYIKEVLAELGVVHFGEMCMKPGKPSTFATVQRCQRTRLFFGLPGNPVSCFVTFKLLAAPAIQRLQGMPGGALYPRVDAVLAQPLQMDPVRPEYHRARARWESGRIIAESTGFQRSSRIASIAEANCLLEIPKASGSLPRGTVVKALLIGGLRPEPKGFPDMASQPKAPAGSKRLGLLRLDSEIQVNVNGVEVLEERRPREAAAVKAVLETWFKESLDFVVVLVDLSFAATDAELLEVLRSLVQAVPNLEDWLMQRGLKESPLAMLAPVVAGYRQKTLLVTVPSYISKVEDVCSFMLSPCG